MKFKYLKTEVNDDSIDSIFDDLLTGMNMNENDVALKDEEEQ